MDWEFEALPTCPLCATTASAPVLNRRHRGVPLAFVKCAGCDLVYQNPRLTRAALQRYFSSTTFFRDGASPDGDLQEPLGYFDYSNWDHSYRRTAKPRLARIARHAPPPRTLLEIGPATGTFLLEAQRAGYDVRGLEISSALADVARERGLRIDAGFIETAELPAAAYEVVCSFGGITCWFDPLRGLANVRHALRPDGVFVFNHMDIDSAFHRAQGKRNWDFQHACLSLWSRQTMGIALRRAGFDVLFEQRERQIVTLARLAEYLRLRRTLAAVRKLRMDQIGLPVVVPFTRFVICRPARREAGRDLQSSTAATAPATHPAL